MLATVARKLFGSANDRLIKQFMKEVEHINALESELSELTDDALKAKTPELRARLEQGQTLDDILVPAFAVAREAAKRVMGMRHYDVQLIGGMILHQGKIAEMGTGEGKTLMATLAVYLNALTGNGVHLVTVNDYLAKRDAQWMGQLYEFLGLTVGCIVHDMDGDERKRAYAADITYGTNNEYGFDYLRDNMRFERTDMVQRKHVFAIVDEVDSILIDEARTPLIISGPTEDNSQLYYVIDKLIKHITKDDYDLDEKAKSVTLNDDGTNKVEDLLKKEGLIEQESSMYELSSISLVHHINQALRAHVLFTKDKDYIVNENRVIIIDEFTGRMMEGRRYSDGLHQALEAKEGVPVQNENQTLASITFQNYFRLYDKLAGMTGTAMTEAGEFSDIYKLDVVAVPPNEPIARKDEDDDIFRTAQEKYDAIISEIQDCQEKKQPVLVGTASIEMSEHVSKLLKKNKIKHEVLNAKQHEKEAYIIAQAGRPGAVTIATNMAGRGTDIMLGGNPDMLLEQELQASKKDIDVLKAKIKQQVQDDKQTVLDAGGLYVLGTERHESRRIDNQLRGRSGRQGDPGRTKFFLSLEDDLMRIFGSEKISGMLKRLGLDEGESIAHPWISRAIEKAQMRVEQMHYEVRKNLLKFDDVMNDQRKVIYGQRIELMEADDVSRTAKDMIDDISESVILSHVPPKSYPEQWDLEGLEQQIFATFGVRAPVQEWAKEEGVADQELLGKLDEQIDALMASKEQRYGAGMMRLVEKKILLLTLDQQWKDHLLTLDQLRQGISLRAYGQKDPLNEYKREAFVLFEEMLGQYKQLVVERLTHMQLASEDEMRAQQIQSMMPSQQVMVESREDVGMKSQEKRPAQLGPVIKRVSAGERDPANPETWGRVLRNEPCPCGSGKKYKQCHGKL